MAGSADVTARLAAAFAAGFAIQRVLDLAAAAFGSRLTENGKKLVLGLLSLLLATLVAVAFPGLRVMAALSTVSGDLARSLDFLITVVVISAGTEGFNSIMKFLGYAKEQKKANAAEAKAAAAYRTAMLQREAPGRARAADAGQPEAKAMGKLSLVQAERIVKDCIPLAGGTGGPIDVGSTLEEVGIPDEAAVSALRDEIVTNGSVGVPAHGATIDPNALQMSPKTKVWQARQQVYDGAQ
jgi:hypothetical protein